MTQHATRNWSAKIEATHYAGHHHTLVVVGEVQTLTTAEHPSLKEAVPQGINPRILLLDLAIPSSGIGGDIVAWKTVTFHKGVAAHQYDEVTIMGHDAKGETVKVHEVVAAK